MDSSVVQLAGPPERIFQAWQALRQAQGTEQRVSGKTAGKRKQGGTRGATG